MRCFQSWRGLATTSAGLLLGATAAACSTTESGGGEFNEGQNAAAVAIDASADGAPKLALAERLYRELEPELAKNCGRLCHQEGVTESAPPWMKAPAYDTIRAYPGIVLTDVYSSKLLVKPNHLGISLQDKSLAAMREKVITWLTAEAEAKNANVIETAPFPVQSGANGVDLSLLSKDIGGARLTFDATLHPLEQNQILQLQNVKIQAPANTALKIVHPMLIIVPDGKDVLPEKDPLDQFSTVEQTIGAGQLDPLGPGSAMLVRFPLKAQLKIRFERIGTPAALGAVRTCKSVAAFTANAVPAIQSNGCLACHGGADKGAVNAVDMSKVGTDDAAACVQVLNKVNFDDRAKSAIVLAPTSGNAANHSGGKNLDPTSDFVTKMMTWIQAE